MMKYVRTFSQWFLANWERVLFVMIGLSFVGSCFYFLFAEKVPEAAAVFGLAFLSFIYANVARFKRFKGLGFEAELWEDKKQEAAALIERLRDVVSIYSREIILGRVTAGRLVDSVDWQGHWKLYDDLVRQHGSLGQKIDFSELKKTMDDYYLFDLVLPELNKLRAATMHGKSEAMEKIHKEFGTPIRDAEGYAKRLAQHRAVRDGIDDPFDVSTRTNLAAEALSMWRETKELLKQHFDVDASVDPDVIGRLDRIAQLYQSRPVKITDALIRWGRREA